MIRLRALALLAVLVSAAAPAVAQDIYINEQNVTGTDLSGRTFTNVQSVHFDESGGIHITAPQYDIQVAGRGSSTATQSSALPASDPWWLIAVNPEPGSVPYRFNVLVNGTVVGTVTSDTGQLAEEITEHIVPGANTIRVQAYREAGAAGTGDESDTFRLIIGSGVRESTGVRMSRTVVNVTRTGADTDEHYMQVFEFEL